MIGIVKQKVVIKNRNFKLFKVIEKLSFAFSSPLFSFKRYHW